MATKARKVAVYGKKKKNDFADEFARLSLSPAKKDRAPLAALSANAAISSESPPATAKPAAPKAATRRKARGPPQAPAAAPPSSLPSIEDEATLKYLQPLVALKYVEERVCNFQAFANLVGLAWEKIGEGSYGDVFRLTVGSEVRIIKCIPLRPKRGPGSKSKFTPVKEAADEIAIATRMQPTEGFVDFCTAQVVYGSYPSQCVEAWNRFKEWGEVCETPDPNKPDSYAPDQLWVLMQMKDAGMGLERYCDFDTRKSSGLPVELSMWQTFDIFWDVVKAMARGEENAQFEHRDLHLGNICIQHLEESTVYGPENINLIQYGSTRKLGWTSIKTTIIDYTLSRVSMEDGSVRYNPMKDAGLFVPHREGLDLQYTMYPLMRDRVLGLGCRKDEKKWSEYHPETNAIWLWHLLTKLLKASGLLFSLDQDPDLTEASHQHVTLTRLREMRDALHGLHARLEPGQKTFTPPIESASDLLSYALDRGWLSPEDVVDGIEDGS